MPATIVVGGQYGSEGKGKVVALLAERSASPWIVRCGGPNSGHTVTVRGEEMILRQVPCSSDPDRATFYIAAGCAVHTQILIRELDLLAIPRDRIIVDPRAVLIWREDETSEADSLGGIASTCSGTGAALARRMSRQPNVELAAQSAVLNRRCRVEIVAPILHRGLADGAEVIVEGTQGFSLSLLHGPEYPFVTSRDTTAAGFAAEVGLSPRDVESIVMVIRTFPIRVGGSSGTLPHETTWEAIASSSDAPAVVHEYTSVTKRLRRVGEFDWNAVRVATEYNKPTALAIMGLDRLDHANTGLNRYEDLSWKARSFLERVDFEIGVPVRWIGTGFTTQDVIHAPMPTPQRDLIHV
jgi:adenylosuccinate synthase